MIGYYVPADAKTDPEDLRSWLAGKLPAYMVPAVFVMLDKLPLSANGKVDRKQLPEPAVSDAATVTGDAPAAATEDDGEIARLVAEVLGTDGVASDENLLQLGATSIEMIRIANALDQKLGFRPRMDDFYRDPSINGLTTLLGQQQPAAPQAAGQAANRGDPLQTPDWVLADIDKILDPEDRARFKDSRPGIRRFPHTAARVELKDHSEPMEAYTRHRSYREFSAQPLAFDSLVALLSKLRSIELNGSPKYLYASAGGLYPVPVVSLSERPAMRPARRW